MIKVYEMFRMVGELNVESLFLKTSSKPKRYFLKVDIVNYRTSKREKKWVLFRFILECVVIGGHGGILEMRKIHV